MDISDRVHVLNFGRTVTEGAPDEVQNHAGVKEAYLGKARDRAAS
jgi:ABC-type branched-subunit amino acid transport system ATPase component